MSYINYHIYKTPLSDATKAITDLLHSASLLDEHILRLTFFVDASDNSTHRYYALQVGLATNNWSESTKPLVSVISQKPLDCTIALEVQSIKKQAGTTVTFADYNQSRYVVVNIDQSKILLSDMLQVSDKKLSIKAQSDEIFDQMRGILNQEKIELQNVLREWNYIEHITYVDPSLGQHYQQFNDSRSHYYNTTSWIKGYPAATGIGTQSGGIQIMFDAIALSDSIRAIDNTLQIAAHKYSDEVLLGDCSTITTPKFERAKSLSLQNTTPVYISGTAAIRGEESLFNTTVEEQTVATLENIDYLISSENLQKYNVSFQKLPQLKVIRAYIKHEDDYSDSQKVIETNYRSIPTLYLHSDICREELLIELEALAN